MLSSVLEASADDGTIADMDRLHVLALILSAGGSGGGTNASAQPPAAEAAAATNTISSQAEAAHSERAAAAVAQTATPVLEARPCLVLIFMVKDTTRDIIVTQDVSVMLLSE